MEDGLYIVGEQALTREQYAAYRRMRDRDNARDRERRANDPEYRERSNAYFRAWRDRNREHFRKYHRERARRMRLDPAQREKDRAYAREYRNRNRPRVVGSLHGLACTGPTRATGCQCHKILCWDRPPRLRLAA
jgi:ferric-dicitrate binding protein FerR (iron transport regulator)